MKSYKHYTSRKRKEEEIKCIIRVTDVSYVLVSPLCEKENLGFFYDSKNK